MSFEDDLIKFKKQVDSFSIAGAAGNFHTGFSIGDDTRGAGAGGSQVIPNTLEGMLTHLEHSFKNFTIRGGHDVSVSGSLVGGGFAISAKGGIVGSGSGEGGPTPVMGCTDPTATNFDPDATEDDGSCVYPMGACCFDDGTCVVESETTCGDDGGTYQGDDTECDPNPCTQPTCSVSITSASISGTVKSCDDFCVDSPCDNPCEATISAIATSVGGSTGFDFCCDESFTPSVTYSSSGDDVTQCDGPYATFGTHQDNFDDLCGSEDDDLQGFQMEVCLFFDPSVGWLIDMDPYLQNLCTANPDFNCFYEVILGFGDPSGSYSYTFSTADLAFCDDLFLCGLSNVSWSVSFTVSI